MQMKMQLKILGAKATDFTTDDGQRFDNTKVYVETALDDSRGNAKGFGVAEYAFGTSAEFEKLKSLTFPLVANCNVAMVTNGKVQKMVIQSLEPQKG